MLDYCQVSLGNSIMQTNECLALLRLCLFFYNFSPLPCLHPACSKFCVHLEFLPEIVCKVRKVRSTFHDYLNFCGEKKDDKLLTIYLFIDFS